MSLESWWFRRNNNTIAISLLFILLLVCQIDRFKLVYIEGYEDPRKSPNGRYKTSMAISGWLFLGPNFESLDITRRTSCEFFRKQCHLDSRKRLSFRRPSSHLYFSFKLSFSLTHLLHLIVLQFYALTRAEEAFGGGLVSPWLPHWHQAFVQVLAVVIFNCQFPRPIHTTLSPPFSTVALVKSAHENLDYWNYLDFWWFLSTALEKSENWKKSFIIFLKIAHHRWFKCVLDIIRIHLILILINGLPTFHGLDSRSYFFLVRDKFKYHSSLLDHIRIIGIRFGPKTGICIRIIANLRPNRDFYPEFKTTS